MDATRLRLMKIIGAVDPDDRFRIYTPKTAGGQDIYVHAKVMIVDDAFLKIGSANMNNRSLGLDSECDLALIDDDRHRACVRAVRERLMAEHLGATEEQVPRSVRAHRLAPRHHRRADQARKPAASSRCPTRSPKTPPASSPTPSCSTPRAPTPCSRA